MFKNPIGGDEKLIIIHFLVTLVIALFNVESGIAYLRYKVGLSPFQIFIAMSIISSCIIIFWALLYEKILKWLENWQKDGDIQKAKKVKKILLKFARWIAKKRRSDEKYKGKKIIRKILNRGYIGKHFGLYLCGIIPNFFQLGLFAQKVIIRSRYGLICIWLGGITRLAVDIFAGLKLIDCLVKVIF